MYNKQSYPQHWKELAVRCKQRAQWRCEDCHVEQGEERVSKRTGSVYQVFLHAAHVSQHDTLNPQPELKALCPICHGRMDWQLRLREKEIALECMKHRMLVTVS
jgi:hypothetical protein